MEKEIQWKNGAKQKGKKQEKKKEKSWCSDEDQSEELEVLQEISEEVLEEETFHCCLFFLFLDLLEGQMLRMKLEEMRLDL